MVEPPRFSNPESAPAADPHAADRPRVAMFPFDLTERSGGRRARRYGRGYAMSSAEKIARRERLERIGRLCEPPFGGCITNAATRQLVVTVTDPDLPDGKETITVVACASHALKWQNSEKTPWATVHSVFPLPERRPPAHVSSVPPRLPVPIAMSLILINVDPETGEDLPGAEPYEVQCSDQRLADWEDNDSVRIISGKQLPTVPGAYFVQVQPLGSDGEPDGEPYEVTCQGRELPSLRTKKGVRILSILRASEAVSVDTEPS